MAAIPPKLEPDVLAKAADGLGLRAISAWLLTEHAVKASHVTVGKLLGKLKSERADIAKAVAREKLAPHVTSDLDRIEKFAKKAAERADRADDDKTFVLLVEEMRKLTETKLHFAGADDPETERKVTGGLVVMLPPDDDRR